MTPRLPVLLRSWLSIVWLAAAALLIVSNTAHAFPANQCAADRKASDLNCTAGDVSITGMRVVGDTTSCVGGTDVTLDLEMTVNFAVPDRWDIGIFISNDGKSPQTRAASGGAATCSVSVLPPSSPFLNLDGGATGDTCGDGNGGIGGGTGSGIHYMPSATVACRSLSGAGGNLYIPFVVSWDNQKTPPGDVCTSNLDPVPNTTSKCNAPTVVQGTVAVVVLPAIANTDGKTTLFSGDSTAYAVTITNTTGVSLSGAVFKDPAVAGITVNSLSCSAAGGATCPASTIGAMQGAGITIPAMPAGSSVTFTLNSTLTGSPGETRTNTATVSVGSQTNTATDTDTIVGTISMLPTPQAKSGDKGATVTYTYTLYNFGTSADVLSLSAVSSRGWTVTPSPTPASVPAGGSTTITLTVNVPGSASVGDVDTTTVTATSSAYPGKTATGVAVTTVTKVLDLTPSNTGSGGAGSYVYYVHRVQNNASTSKDVSLTPSFTGGTCTGWSTALYESNKTASLTTPVPLAANGGYKDFALKVTIPSGAAASSTCTVTLTAAFSPGGASATSVTDVTTVKNLVLYEDPGYAAEQSTYPVGNSVYAKGFGLDSSKSYEYRWYDSSGAEVCTPRQLSTTGTTFPDTCTIPAGGPLGTWTVQIWNRTNNVLFVQGNFYVGPDHLKASYSGANPPIDTDTVIDLALHDRLNHVVPVDPSGNLVKGSPTDPEGPLMVTVTVSGSATIVSTTLTNATISGQTVTGKLDSTTGTATVTIRDSVGETVTVTPSSYKGLLYGSPVRDEPVTVTFVGGPHHVRLDHTGSAVTCLGEQVTVNSCSSADTGGSCTANTGGLTGNVVAKSSGGAVLATVPFTIAAGSSSTTVNVNVTTAQTVTFETSGLSTTTTASPSWTCWDGSAASCNNVFSDAGFIFSTTAGGAEATIPTQTAGVWTATAPVYSHQLRAVKTSTTTKACEAALSGATSVDLAYECVDPGTCYAADLFSVDGGSGAATIARNNSGSVSSYTPVNVTFDANGNAGLDFAHADVGQIKIHARKAAGGSLLKALAGSSNAFVVIPHNFLVVPCATAVAPPCTTLTAPADPGTAGGGAAFARAGEAFQATVTARQLAGNIVPSFGLGTNNGTETVALARNRVAPAGAAADGVLGGSVSIARNAFSNGVATVNDLTWSEVGVITLTATNANFLGVVSGVSGTSQNIGRFIPDHFDTAVVPVLGVPMACPAELAGICPLLFNGIVYSGQAFTVDATARNSAGNTTQNYDGALGYAHATNLTAWNAIGGAVQNPSGALANGAVPAASFANGVASTGTPVYTLAPFPTAPTNIFIRAVDAVDPVTSLRAAPAVSIEGGVAVVNGRVRVSNAFGSSQVNLPVPAEVQYWTGTFWRVNTQDSVSTIAPGAVTPISGGGAAYTAGGPFAAARGSFNMVLAAPLAPTAVNLAFGVAPWLRFPWGGGAAAIDPAARASFGIYPGSNRFIYRREVR